MTLRCMEKNNTKIGAMAMAEAAIMRFQSEVCWPAKVAMPALSGMFDSRVVTISGHNRSFQLHSTVVMATANRLGLTSGNITFQNTCQGLQPSRRAASSSSFGSDMNACRIRNVPKAENRPGNTMPHGVSNRLSPLMIWY